MGDRANVEFFNEEGERLFFYTHHEGSRLPWVVKRALERGKTRWDDSSYLARIIFCELIRNDVDGLTGFGIDTRAAGDAQWPAIQVNMRGQSVTIGAKIWSFEDFIEVSDDEIERAYQET